MKKLKIGYLLLVLLALGFAAVGCVSTKPEQFTLQVKKWVPVGTPAKEAERIMTHKGFECRRLRADDPFNPYGVDFLGCEREQVFQHDWSVKIFLKDDKVSGYGPVTVDEVGARE